MSLPSLPNTPGAAQAGPLPVRLSGQVLVAATPGRERDALVAAIEALGLSCRSVDDGALAIEAVARQHYDALLIGCEMAVLDGMPACKVMRALDCVVPIVALLSASTDSLRAAWRQLGCQHILVMPADGAALAAALGAVLGHKDLPPSDTGFEHLPAFAGFRLTFRATLGERLRQLKLAAAAADWADVAATAHIIKGGGGTFGFPQVSQCAAVLETAAVAADADAVAAALGALQQLLLALGAGGVEPGAAADVAPAPN